MTSPVLVERVLHALLECSLVSGSEYFECLVRTIGQTLDVSCVFVGETTTAAPGRITTLAVWEDGALRGTFEYPLSGTLCENVMSRECCHIESGAARRFPADKLLAQKGIDSYLGVPMRLASGVTLGLMVAMDTKPLAEPRLVQTLLQISAAQAAAQLERERALRSAQESEHRFRVLADSEPVMVWMADAGGLRRYFNKQWLQFTGRSTERESGNGWAEHIHPDDHESFLATYAEAYAARRGVEIEYRLSRRDGEYRWLLDHGVPRFAEDGSFAGYVGSCVDLTDRKRAEEASRASMARLNAVLDNVLDGIITIGGSGVIETFNPAAERLFGYAASEVVGANVKVLMPEPYHSEHDSYLQKYRRSGVAKVIGIGREVVGRRKDGTTFAMDLGVSEFRLNGRHCFVGLVRDIEERKRAEAALRESDRRKDEFLAMLAHELRNPLAPIRNAVAVLHTVDDAEPRVQLARDIVGRQVQHLARLVDDLLDVSRITRGRVVLRRAFVALASVVDGAVEASGPLIEARRQRLTVTLPDEPVHLSADATRLAQVLGNLLNNAAKFTPEGGAIEVAAERVGQDVVLRVRDNGVGIEAGLLEHIFEPFVQSERALDRSQGGLGIGLTLVKGLVTLHGGSVDARSAGPGQGSEFIVRLPAEPDLANRGTAAPVPPSAEPPTKAARRRILVIDDNVDSAQSLALLLEVEGHEVSTAHHAEAALRAARSFRPDAVLLDIGLPGKDGFAVAAELRGMPETEQALLIAMTGYGREEDRRRSRAAGFDHHLVKPVDAAQLGTLLRRAGNGTPEAGN